MDLDGLFHSREYIMLVGALKTGRATKHELYDFFVDAANHFPNQIVYLHPLLADEARRRMPDLSDNIVNDPLAPYDLFTRLPPIHPRGRGRRNPRVCPTCKRA